MVSPRLWHVTSFYRFVPLSDGWVGTLRDAVREWMLEHRLLGLVVLATEGINGTVAGTPEDVEAFKPFVVSLLELDDLRFKDSISETAPFHRISVDIRSEIVGLKRPDLAPASTENRYLTPDEWHEALNSEGSRVVIDVRNAYETLAGKFKDAIDPGLKSFSDWNLYLDSAHIPNDVPILLYCTGGIRCEKAALAMQQRGYEQVYQLRDGILGYLAEYPDEMFEGECFVFDDRVTLGQDLKPTGNFGICPGCGLTSGSKRECDWCGDVFFLCQACEASWGQVCSKTCLDRWRRHGARVSRISGGAGPNVVTG